MAAKRSAEEKAEDARQRLIDTSKQFAADTYCRRFVAPLFQKMVRAEHACLVGPCLAVVDGRLTQVSRRPGQCVCVTCGKIDAWNSGIKGMHTGHFVASRRNSILLLEENCAPQCSSCNFYRDGAPSEFRIWMEAVRGIDVIERIQNLKRTSVSFRHDDLVDMRIEYSKRLKAAELKMKGN